jgi:hypothetical protein
MSLEHVFIGLVSHAKTSFPENQGSEGLAAKLHQSFRDCGIRSELQVNTSNLFDENCYPLTPEMARDSVKAEIRLESRWADFLGRRDSFREMRRLLGRSAKYLASRQEYSQTKDLRRLLNIEYSHVDLYRKAVDSGAKWAVILEDDAASIDAHNLATGLAGLFMAKSDTKIINLSASFPLALIGVQQMLTVENKVRWEGPSARIVYQSERPATNTVCAIAFRTDFLAQILADFDSQPTEAVVPIDWKLNSTLMRLWDAKAIGPNECWFIEPAPVIQLSMVRDREGK